MNGSSRHYPFIRLALVLIILALVLILVWSGSHLRPPRPHSEEEKAIYQVLLAQVDAWNHGDLEGFMTGYWQSPELSFFAAGDRKRGWQDTLQGYRQRYQADGKEMGKLTFDRLEIEVLGPTSAWVRGRWLLTKKEPASGLFTLVFKKLPEGWRIVHDHTSDEPLKKSAS